MSKRKYCLTTPYGAVYYIHDNGNIERDDMPGKPSGQWTMLGLKHVALQQFIPFKDLEAKLPELTLKYKNGKPQYTVRDLDHGTMREWGNTKYHGVASISLLK